MPWYEFIMNQLLLLDHNNPFKLFAPQRGRRKGKRPLSSRHPIHIILKSKSCDLKRKEREILRWWAIFGSKFGVKSYQIVVNLDHVHAIVRLHSPRLFTPFIRALAGTIARCLKVKWRGRPATRIATWGRDFKRLVKYLKLNFLEANGFLDYEPARTRRLPHWLKL